MRLFNDPLPMQLMVQQTVISLLLIIEFFNSKNGKRVIYPHL